MAESVMEADAHFYIDGVTISTFAVLKDKYLVAGHTDKRKPVLYSIDMQTGKSELIDISEMLKYDYPGVSAIKIYQPAALSEKIIITVADKRNVWMIYSTNNGGKTWVASTNAFTSEVEEFAWSPSTGSVCAVKYWEDYMSWRNHRLSVLTNIDNYWSVIGEIDEINFRPYTGLKWNLSYCTKHPSNYSDDRLVIALSSSKGLLIYEDNYADGTFSEIATTFGSDYSSCAVRFWTAPDGDVYMVRTRNSSPIVMMSKDNFETVVYAGDDLDLSQGTNIFNPNYDCIIDGWTIDGDTLYAHSIDERLFAVNLAAAVAGVDEIDADGETAMKVYARNGELVVESADTTQVTVVNMTGMARTYDVSAGTTVISDLQRGIYVVNGNKVAL